MGWGTQAQGLLCYTLFSMTTESTKPQSKGLPNLLAAFCLLGGATLLANFIAAASNTILSPLLNIPADLTVLNQIPLNQFTTLLSFIVPSVLATIYIFPVFRICFTGKLDASLPLAQRRLLNMPLVLGLIGLSGWLIGMSDILKASLNVNRSVLLNIAGYLFNNVLTGSVVFVISYYLLEFISRKYFIPGFFPQGKLSECQGTLALSIRARFYIFFFAVGIVPVFFMYRVVRAISVETGMGDRLNTISIVTGVVLLLGGLLTYLISKSYQGPLIEMARSAQRIQASDYAIRIGVVSNDEVGNLGEALNEMAAELKEKEFIKDTFGKVVDPRVRDHLLGGHITLGGEIREAAILYSDIRDFTTISAGMKPDQVVDWLNKYFDRMSQCIADEGGVVNKYVGDAILAVFGVPIGLDKPTAAALRAAYKMRAAKAELNNDLLMAGLPAVHSGIAIHTGPVLAGNIGSKSRMEYTVIGDTVNVAARMEKLCKEFNTDIILSEPSVVEVEVSEYFDLFQIRDLGLVDIRGKEQPIRVFSLL